MFFGFSIIITCVYFVNIVTSLSLRTCIPNTKFILDDLICKCDSDGHFELKSCQHQKSLYPYPTPKCSYNQTDENFCGNCTFNSEGEYICGKNGTANQNVLNFRRVLSNNLLTSFGRWCKPSRTYYINCSLCTCPKSGYTESAQCFKDKSKAFPESLKLENLLENHQNQCSHDVMYLFPCFHCLCNKNMTFDAKNCIKTCDDPDNIVPRSCVPKKFFKMNCDLCFCPDNGIPDLKTCKKMPCNHTNIRRSDESNLCEIYSFTEPTCYDCSCDDKGNTEADSCIMTKCTNNTLHGIEKACKKGAIIQQCKQCFCFPGHKINETYCTNKCTYENRLKVIEMIIANNLTNSLDLNHAEVDKSDNFCNPDTMFIENKNFCLCPHSGNSHFKKCKAISSKRDSKKYYSQNVKCKPNSFFDFECKTCYCDEKGVSDPKWCTYHSDCVNYRNAKVEENNKTHCQPGSISTHECNYCVCPTTGLKKDKICTKLNCRDLENTVDHHELSCSPLSYYEVDCNVCICPKGGTKNLASCTKTVCDKKKYLRSDGCVPGQLFCDGCNICLCPASGSKDNIVCTNNTDCVLEDDTPMPLNNFNLKEDKKVNINKFKFCNPGEEFVVDCKICVCSNMGLQKFADCSEGPCEAEMEAEKNELSLDDHANVFDQYRRIPDVENCTIYENSSVIMLDKHNCTPGEVYLNSSCQQCICPQKEANTTFCRPIPPKNICTKITEKINAKNGTNPQNIGPKFVLVHNHTKHDCYNIGHVMDKCFICECEEEESVIIEEHCFKSDEKDCFGKIPLFWNRLI